LKAEKNTRLTSAQKLMRKIKVCRQARNNVEIMRIDKAVGLPSKTTEVCSHFTSTMHTIREGHAGN